MTLSTSVTAPSPCRCCRMLDLRGLCRICWISTRVLSRSVVCRSWMSTVSTKIPRRWRWSWWERQQAWLAEIAVRITARVAGPTPPPDPESRDPFGRDSIDGGVNLVAATLGMTTGGAQTRADVARQITESLPHCQSMMAAGFMGYRQAWIVAEAVRAAGLGQLGIAAVDERIASLIKGQSWAVFRRTLRRAVLAAKPDLVLAEHMVAVKERWVEKIDFHDTAMSQFQIKMSAVDAQTVWLGLDSTAMQLQGDAQNAGLMDEGIDAYRSDALVVWANNALADPNAPRRQGRRQQVQFVTDLPSLLGLADNPAEMLGFGPIPAALVRDPRAGRRVAAARRRPGQRLPARLRQRDLPATGATEGLPARPRPALPVSRLQHPRQRVRHRPQHPCSTRGHLSQELLLPVPPPPPTQNLRRLDRPTPTRRQLLVDITIGPPVRLRPTTPTRLKCGSDGRKLPGVSPRAA